MPDQNPIPGPKVPVIKDETHLDDEPIEVKRKIAEARARIQYGMLLLQYTSWWFQWRAFVLGTTILVTDKSVPTACVGYNHNTGKVDFYFNVDFAIELSGGDIAYILAHEAFHVIYDHLSRMKKYPLIWNIATDAFINEYLDNNCNWGMGVSHKDRLDFMVTNGIKWKSLPQEVQDKFPRDRLNDYCAEDVYNALLEHFHKKGVEAEELEKRLDDVQRKGKKLGKGPKGGSGKIVRRPVPIKVGDPVFVKSEIKGNKVSPVERYGIIKKITPGAKPENTEVEIEIDDSLCDKDFLREIAKNSLRPGAKMPSALKK